MIFFSPNLLKLFQYYPKIQSIFILSPSYLHLISIHRSFILRFYCSFIVRSLFVFCSFIVRLLFVFCSFFVRSLFVLCSFARATRTVFCSFIVRCRPTVEPLKDHSLFVFCSFIVRHLFVSLFRYNTPSPWERVGERIFCSFFVHLPVWLTPSYVQIIFNLQPYSLLLKTFHTSFLIC